MCQTKAVIYPGPPVDWANDPSQFEAVDPTTTVPTRLDLVRRLR